ncbi:MAG: hypothetical protein OEV43_04465 [Coriobacteriia bacterium]|nr:hypothetical protein [Coriobacteriia bacterium]
MFDAVAAANFIGLLVSEALQFKDAETGFVLYGSAILALYVVAWLTLRRYDPPILATVALQLAFLGHILGRLVVADGVQLYHTQVLGLRGDKLIHAFNSAAGAVFLTVLFRHLRLRLGGWEGLVVVMTACGFGALVEIIEYGGTLVLASTQVGDYANNQQDLIANLVGAIIGWAVARYGLATAPDADD